MPLTAEQTQSVVNYMLAGAKLMSAMAGRGDMQDAQAEFGQDAWPVCVWKPHSGGAWVQFQDRQNAMRALAAERDAALARAEAAEAEVERLRGVLHQIESISPMWEGGVRGPSRDNLLSTLENMKEEARAALQEKPHD